MGDAVEPIRVQPSPALRQWSRRHGFSAELVARWGAFYGDLPALLKALETPPTSCLRLNPLRADPKTTRQRLEEKGFVLETTGVPLTLKIRESPFSAGATEEYLLGQYFLQDMSSALAPLALEPRKGETIGDFCAAPGGKTIQMASLVDDDAAIVAFEPEPSRTKSLRSNLSRCGVTSAAVLEAQGQSAGNLGFQFDRILLDAPCTGEGVISRDPRRRQGRVEEFAACAVEQHELLQAAAQSLRPGGTLVYSTCTLAPEENEFQVQAALETDGLVLEDLPTAVRDCRPQGNALVPGLTSIETRRLDSQISKSVHVLPHLHGSLGFYIARFRKEDR